MERTIFVCILFCFAVGRSLDTVYWASELKSQNFGVLSYSNEAVGVVPVDTRGYDTINGLRYFRFY